MHSKQARRKKNPTRVRNLSVKPNLNVSGNDFYKMKDIQNISKNLCAKKDTEDLIAAHMLICYQVNASLLLKKKRKENLPGALSVHLKQ